MKEIIRFKIKNFEISRIKVIFEVIEFRNAFTVKALFLKQIIIILQPPLKFNKIDTQNICNI